jgi:hypothetical protein
MNHGMAAKIAQPIPIAYARFAVFWICWQACKLLRLGLAETLLQIMLAEPESIKPTINPAIANAVATRATPKIPAAKRGTWPVWADKWLTIIQNASQVQTCNTKEESLDGQ